MFCKTEKGNEIHFREEGEMILVLQKRATICCLRTEFINILHELHETGASDT